MIKRKHNEVVEMIQNYEHSILNQVEFDRLIGRIRTIYGFMSMRKEDIYNYLEKTSLIVREYATDSDGSRQNLYFIEGREIDIFDIAITRSRTSYFSHFSALFINNLTLQIPKQIYLSAERTNTSYRNSPDTLNQTTIDEAFKKTARVTNNKRHYKDNTINFLQGQGYNKLGIVPFREKYLVSDIERTLIDVSVRPFYAGGVTQVLEAYERAKGMLDVDKMYSYYRKMKFIYPYHQAIGFYLEKAGYSEEKQNLFKQESIRFSFYLTYNISRKSFSKKWSLYYPTGL